MREDWNQAAAEMSQPLNALPPVLDACCGSRMMWYDRKDTRAIFVDQRRETWQRQPSETHPKGDTIIVDPDMLADFRKLPFPW